MGNIEGLSIRDNVDSQNLSPNERRKERTSQIVDGILTHGLLSLAEQSNLGKRPFVSSDGQFEVRTGSGNTEIYGRLVIPFGDYVTRRIDKSDLFVGTIDLDRGLRINYLKTNHYSSGEGIPGYLLTDALYGGGVSVMPVLKERQWSGSAKKDEERGTTSCLIAIPLNELDASKMPFKGQAEDGSASVESSIPPDKFAAIILPEKLHDELGEQMRDKGCNVKTVGYIKKAEESVPDYENGIKELLGELGEPLFIHGVRLPTVEDVKSGLV